MNELRHAIEWARQQIKYGGHEWQGLRALLRAVEHPEITAEAIVNAGLLPDWAAGMCYVPQAKKWAVCKARPLKPMCTDWVWGDGNAWSYIYVDLPAPADWKTSWIDAPVEEVRCPECGRTTHIVHCNGRYQWRCNAAYCDARGGWKRTEAKARESARRVSR